MLYDSDCLITSGLRIKEEGSNAGDNNNVQQNRRYRYRKIHYEKTSEFKGKNLIFGRLVGRKVLIKNVLHATLFH
jgi:hypothetical protein